MGDSNNMAVMLALNEGKTCIFRPGTRMTRIKRIYTDYHIRAYPRHPRDPCSIAFREFV